MCGIAGMMTATREGPAPAVLAAMGAALAHRGPDGQKDYRSGNVGLVHNRLAIIDLTTGEQPLYESQGAAIVANGEIYNYIELRQSLHGVNFTSNSDCEPPLHLYRRHGLDFVDRLRGMYGFAIHDPRAGQLLLSRDPFGIKPLYYVETPSGTAFASEAQALLAAGLGQRTVVPTARSELLELQFTTRRDTIFEGIQRVLPGETIMIANGRVVERRRRAALPEDGPIEMSEDEALAQLDRALEDSVTVHQRSDVPYGMFLSGGVDSTALLALMGRLNPRGVRAFTAHFPDSNVPDEREAARRSARAVGAEHIEVPVTSRDFFTLLPKIAAAMDDPAADYATVPTYMLAQAARAVGLKVVLCGEGGDELFAGYGRYRSIVRPWWLGGRTMRRKGTFEGLGVLRDASVGWRDGIGATEITEARPGRTRLQSAQAVDCADWLPHDLLAKLDRCLMAHGVEGRTPFLDPLVASLAFRLPDRLKLRQGKGKWLLRRWLDQAMPEAGAMAPKRGFSVPVSQWIHSEGSRLGPLVASQPGVAEIADAAAVAKLFRDPRKHAGFAAWTLLFYALWHRKHILGLPADGDVFHCLSATR
jgi:asparagine synthase (glutamine-hydrolysing)